MPALTPSLLLGAGPATAPPALTPQRLRECRHCGQLQVVPPMPPAVRAVCLRCEGELRHTHHDPLGVPLALNAAALVLFLIAISNTLIAVSRAGQDHVATLFSGPANLDADGMWELAAVVAFTTIAAPLAKLLATTAALIGAIRQRPSPLLRTVFAWAVALRPWSMIEVYLLAFFVAFVRLGAEVHIDVGPALYALAALMLTMVAADSMLDPEAVWEAIGRHRSNALAERMGAHLPGAQRIGCGTCRAVTRSLPGVPCPRCGFRLRHRKPESLSRTWAFGLAAVVLYIPANVYPVLIIGGIGGSEPSTILGGVRDLLDVGDWPLAALVFFASVLVPGMKVLGLGLLLLSTRAGSRHWLRDRTRLYQFIDGIGRWSMIDIFMGSLLVALLRFGSLASVLPGPGAVAFAAVVILTMLAAHSFDPRLMWDAAGLQGGGSGQ